MLHFVWGHLSRKQTVEWTCLNDFWIWVTTQSLVITFNPCEWKYDLKLFLLCWEKRKHRKVVCWRRLGRVQKRDFLGSWCLRKNFYRFQHCCIPLIPNFVWCKIFHANVFLQIALYVQTNEAETREFGCWFMCPYEDFIRHFGFGKICFCHISATIWCWKFLGLGRVFALVCIRRIRLIFVPLWLLMNQMANWWHYCQTIFLGKIFTLMH